MSTFLERLFTRSSSSQAFKDTKQKTFERRAFGNYNSDLQSNDAHTISTVYACNNILSNTIARLPISIFKKQGNSKIELTNHKYYNSLRYSPQSYYSDHQFKSQLITGLNFKGNSYSYINPDTNELQLIHPELVTDIKVVQNEKTGKADLWYYLSIDNEPTVIRARDILHFKTFSKHSFFGVNPIDSIRLELNIQYKSEKTVDNFFSKNGNTTKVLSPIAGDPKDLTNAKIQELVKDFTEKVSINNNDAIVRIPPLHELKELSLNTDAINFLASNKYTVSQIGSVFGVPEYLLGINTNSQYGKYEEQAIAFRETTIKNLLMMMQAEMNFKLLTIDERKSGISIEFDLSQLDAIDTITRINTLTQLKNAGAVSPNEMRIAFNLPAIDNEKMNGYYMQAQYQNIIESGNTITKLD